MYSLSALSRRLARFFFPRGDTATLELLRVLLGFICLVVILASGPNWLLFYGEYGLSPYDTALGKGLQINYSIFSLFRSNVALFVIYGLALLSAICMTIGFKTRPSVIYLYIVMISGVHRVPDLTNGQDQVSCMLLFFCMFAPLGKRFSVDTYLSTGSFRGSRVETELWALRLIQISVMLIYLFAGPSKCLDDQSWCDGSAFYYVSLSERWFRYPSVEIFHSLALSKIITFSTLIFESLAPFVVLFREAKPFALLALASMHVGAMLLLSPAVFFFNLMMLPALSSLVDNEFAEWFWNRVCGSKNLRT